jgi:hypothetical protein
MKSLKNIIFVLCLMVMASVNYAGGITVVNNNGDWSTPGTWNLNRIPKTGDTVNIPAGQTVQVSSNVYHSVPQYALLQIRVYGVLQFVATGQLNLQCLSSVCVFGSGIIPSTGCNCNQIGMGTGEASWKGAYPSISGGSCVSSPCAALPVTLVSFDAVRENETVKLSWVAEREVNLDYYEVERSADGINFESIRNVNSTGNLSQNYYFTDMLPLGLLSYYRLKTVDLDKTIRYSKMIAVSSSTQISVEIYPNPVTGNNFNVLVPAGSAFEQITVTIKDLIGKEYLYLTYFLNGELLPVSTSSITPGIYVVIVNIGNHSSSSAKIIIQ